MNDKRIVAGLILALTIWGVYLAIGSTGYFVESSLTDPRKSLIVLACMGSFLGLWYFVLRSVRGRSNRIGTAAAADSGDSISSSTNSNPLSDADPGSGSSPWSKPGLTSFVMGVVAIAMWLVAVVTFGRISLVATTVLGWLVVVLVIGGVTSGMIALANPRPLRGKWLGVCGLLQGIVAFVVFVIRMTP